MTSEATELVLSVFPGIGLLDRAFEHEGFCVVRGPDLLWGGDIRAFHPPPGVFNGVIGGPPCQSFSLLANLKRSRVTRFIPRSFADACRLQGLPENFLAGAPFTADGKAMVVGNGVPLAMGRAVAYAVKQASQPAPVKETASRE